MFPAPLPLAYLSFIIAPYCVAFNNLTNLSGEEVPEKPLYDTVNLPSLPFFVVIRITPAAALVP